MKFWIVYRTGWNAANQSSVSGCPHRMAVAKVEAETAGAACDLAAKRVSLYNGQFLDAESAEEVEARETEIDRRVTPT